MKIRELGSTELQTSLDWFEMKEEGEKDSGERR